ncbi:formate dehydrogenase accessory sulfurtransferase FdhD [Aeromonas sp. 1805]|uniref:formate dehydrogenase accessory sulfurtransferase FdhD n=1 Tax=Aeromonas sp. 1805 TaxID=2560028 RepID=UPI00148B1EDD|nr:formate dehydrogenase accessory sulfurtransferase FdhD [Aeromonas sp. 1805]QJT19369.1 formate dehydrogenase accessory sulfurtransferase FdhD [Aeromonas sp. 1805]
MLLEFDPDTPQALSAHREVVHYHQRGVTTDSAMQLPCETPVALVYNGIAHSVMMCSAADLEDFAIGFSLSEGIIDSLLDIHDIEQQSACRGIELHITLANRCVHRLKEKRRTLAGRTGCGICGSESLEQVVRAQPRLPDSQRFAVGHIDKVLAALRPLQLLGQSTGATHAAVHVDDEGNILAIREDVGRHIALDKLVGHLQRSGRRDGAILVTSRASFEMVQKCASAGVEILLAISAATELAVERAERTGLTLVGFCRPGRAEIYSGRQRILLASAASSLISAEG